MENNKNYNTIIVGAGMSGMSAAIYLKRANLDVCIIEKAAPGGQLLRTSIVENYPAFPKVEGSTLAIQLYDQIRTLEIPLRFEEVTKIQMAEDKKGFLINNQYSCKNIIIATGRMYRKLGLENEEKLTGKGISYCAICDGALYKNKNVAVIGAGNSAFEEAIYLSNLCSEVTIISRRSEFRADRGLIHEVKNKENIHILTDCIVEKIVGEDKLEELLLKNTQTEEKISLKIEGCFIYIGQDPETKISEELGIKTNNGYILTDENMQTNIQHIYACGDCREKKLYQLVTATYDGAIAADQIIRQN